MNAFEVEAAAKVVLTSAAGAVPILAGSAAGSQSWPRVLVKVTASAMREDEAWRGDHSLAVLVQSRFDADNAGLTTAAAYAAHVDLSSALWAALEQRALLTAALVAVNGAVSHAALQGYRADVDAKQGLFVSLFEVEIRTA